MSRLLRILVAVGLMVIDVWRRGDDQGSNDVIHNYGRAPMREGAMLGTRANEIGEWFENLDRRLEAIDSRSFTPLLTRDQAECETIRIVIFFPSTHRFGLN